MNNVIEITQIMIRGHRITYKTGRDFNFSMTNKMFGVYNDKMYGQSINCLFLYLKFNNLHCIHGIHKENN